MNSVYLMYSANFVTIINNGWNCARFCVCRNYGHEYGKWHTERSDSCASPTGDEFIFWRQKLIQYESYCSQGGLSMMQSLSESVLSTKDYKSTRQNRLIRLSMFFGSYKKQFWVLFLKCFLASWAKLVYDNIQCSLSSLCKTRNKHTHAALI